VVIPPCAHGHYSFDKRNVHPSQSANLISPLAGEQEQSHNVSEPIIANGPPKLTQFILRQHSFSTPALVDFGCAFDWISVKQSLSDRPTKERAQCTTSSITGHWTSSPLYLPQH